MLQGHRYIFFLCPRDSAEGMLQDMVQKAAREKNELPLAAEENGEKLSAKTLLCAVGERQK